MNAQRRGEETRARILAAAAECFARYGYNATGVAEICHQAGVSKGAFYHHFASKQAVFLELLSQWLEGLDAQLEAAHGEADNVPEALLHMASMTRQVFQDASGQLPIFLEFWTQAAHDPAVWQATVAPYRRYRSFFARLVQDGIAEGTLQPVDPETAAQAVVSLAIGVLLQGMLDPQGADWGRVMEDSLRMFLDGLRRRQG